MPVIVKQGKRDESIAAGNVVAASEIGPTTYGVGQPRQEKWEEYQPEVAEEMAASKAKAEERAELEQSAADVVVKADGGKPFADEAGQRAARKQRQVEDKAEAAKAKK